MFPIKMIYQATESGKTLEADVYSFHSTCDADGVITEILVTAWIHKNKSWLTAPVWCFKPIETKILKEGD